MCKGVFLSRYVSEGSRRDGARKGNGLMCGYSDNAFLWRKFLFFCLFCLFVLMEKVEKRKMESYLQTSRSGFQVAVLEEQSEHAVSCESKSEDLFQSVEDMEALLKAKDEVGAFFIAV